MRTLELVKRNLKEAVRDPLSLGVSIVMPAALFVIFQVALGDVSPVFEATSLAPGMAIFGFAMLTLSTAMSLAQDRETALFSRFLTTPLRANEFVIGYSVPYLIVAMAQAVIVFVIGLFLGLEIAGSILWVVLVLLLMATWHIAMGMIIGSLVPYKAVSGVWAPLLILAILGGTWMDLEEIGGVLQTVGGVLPFAHAIDATRAVMIDGAGLGDIAADLLWVSGYTVGVVVIAVWVFRRKMVE